MAEQNYSNHTRYFPLFHFVVFPLLALNLIYQVVRLYQEPSLDRGVFVIASIVFILMILAARLEALTVQNRVIRLEERLRYREILSPEIADTAAGLPLGKIIALRFASDEELPSLVERALNGELNTPDEIKRAVKNWRADFLRA